MKKILTILFVIVSLVSFGQARHKEKFGVYSLEDTVYFKRVVYNSGAGIVHLGLDTVASSPTFGKLVRKTAGGGSTTLQQALTAGSTLTTDNDIDLDSYYLNFLLDGDIGTSYLSLRSLDPTYGNRFHSLITNNDTTSLLKIDRGGITAEASKTGATSRLEVAPHWVDISNGSEEIYVGIGETGLISSAFYLDLDGATGSGYVLTDVAGDNYVTMQPPTVGKTANVTLTESSATTFYSTTIATSTISGGEIIVTIESNDATDFQSRTLRFIWSAANKAGTLTITISTPEEVVAVSSGTLTTTITAVDAGSGVLQFKSNAVSSLTQTTLRSQARVIKNF